MLAVHLAAWLAVSQSPFGMLALRANARVTDDTLRLTVQLLPEPQPTPKPAPPRANTPPPQLRALQANYRPKSATAITPASMDAPPAPTAEQWAFAGSYSLRNSKAYRYTWGQQVRSMMGTAVEGPEQGAVRFRIEIAPNGSLTRIDTVWSTSKTAERLARQAIRTMPPLPPTPTGKPLVFEKTISFSPFATDGPPVYKYDCEPEKAVFRNRYAWDGQSPRSQDDPEPPVQALDAKELEECLKQLPGDSIDAEMARDRHKIERWGWGGRKEGPVQ